MPLSIKIDLRNVIYISYRVPIQRLRPFVPSKLKISVDHEDMAYVSFVAMNCRRVHLNVMPWPRFNYDQLNLRTYVEDPQTGDPAVYFFQSGVSIGIIPFMTRLAGIPWEKISFALESSSPSAFRASGEWLGKLGFEIVSPEGSLPPDSIVKHLTGPMMVPQAQFTVYLPPRRIIY